MFVKIFGESYYKSPTDMGVNMVGNCITDNEVCENASRQEIVRRYLTALCDKIKEKTTEETINKLTLLMEQNSINVSERKVVSAAINRSEKTKGEPATAIELNDGTIITGKTSDLLGSTSAMLLNALKYLGGINDNVILLPPSIIEPIQELKIKSLGNKNPRLHTDEILIALSISAVANPVAKTALEQLPKLKGAQVHSTVILSQVDINVLKKLGIDYTSEAKYQTKKLFQK
jgi:uncharacterized protein (UPF0371 family)